MHLQCTMLKPFLVHGMLQALKQARKHIVPPAAAVAATLYMALKRDIKQQSSGMSAMFSGLLDLWHQGGSADAEHQLSAESASMLAVLLTREERWSEAAGIFEDCVDSKQVCLS